MTIKSDSNIVYLNNNEAEVLMNNKNLYLVYYNVDENDNYKEKILISFSSDNISFNLFSLNDFFVNKLNVPQVKFTENGPKKNYKISSVEEIKNLEVLKEKLTYEELDKFYLLDSSFNDGYKTIVLTHEIKNIMDDLLMNYAVVDYCPSAYKSHQYEKSLIIAMEPIEGDTTFSTTKAIVEILMNHLTGKYIEFFNSGRVGVPNFRVSIMRFDSYEDLHEFKNEKVQILKDVRGLKKRDLFVMDIPKNGKDLKDFSEIMKITLNF